MATVTLEIVIEEDENLTDVLMDLTNGLDISFDETGVQYPDGHPELEFGGPVSDLEIMLGRYNGNAGIEQFGELLKMIKE